MAGVPGPVRRVLFGVFFARPNNLPREEAAYALLRRTAMNEHRKIAEVAQSVITAAELFK